MTEHVVVLPLAPIEGVHLGGLITQFLELLAVSGTADAGVARLTPDAYPDDDDANEEFAEATRNDLLARRHDDAELVQAALARFAAAGPGADETEDDVALGVRDLVIPLDELDAWLRTLTALRLVIASRLGIASDEALDHDDPTVAVYEWLGYRLDGLVQLADERS